MRYEKIIVCIKFVSLLFLNVQPSQFFSQQLAAFQVWLLNCSDSRKPPEQLPIVLQV